MTVTVFGANGRSGRRVVRRLRERRHEVRAAVRDPRKLPGDDGAVRVVTADVLDADAVAAAVAGADAVVSLIGHTRGTPPDMQTRGVRHIIAAMQEHGIRRLIALTGSGVRFPGDRPVAADRLLTRMLGHLAPDRLADGERYARIIAECDLDWTIVRAPVLHEFKPRRPYRVGPAGPETGMTCSRENIARFVAAELENPRHLRQAPVVTD